MEFSKNYNRDAKVILHIIITATWQKVLSDKTKTKTGFWGGGGGFSSPSPPPKKTGQPNQNGIAPILGAMVRVDVLF